MNESTTDGAKQSSESQVNEVVGVSRNQLPLSCPLPEGELWNMHPRVYLEIEKTGRIQCPYCGTIYELEGD